MTNLTDKFNIEDLIDLSCGNTPPMFEILEPESIYDHGSWTVSYSLVFKYLDKFYRMGWRVGATEYQEVDFNPIVREVFPKEITKTVYVTNA